MEISEIKIGDLITNGSQAGTVRALVDKDPRWKVPGVRIENVTLEAFGGNRGMSQVVPGYLLSGWRILPEDWTPVVGGGVEERYVWARDYSRMTRQVRRIEAPSEPSPDDVTTRR